MIKGKIQPGKPKEAEEEVNIMMTENTANGDHTINISELKTPADAAKRMEYRTVRVPNHRYTPLRNNWEKIVSTIVENL